MKETKESFMIRCIPYAIKNGENINTEGDAQKLCEVMWEEKKEIDELVLEIKKAADTIKVKTNAMKNFKKRST